MLGKFFNAAKVEEKSKVFYVNGDQEWIGESSLQESTCSQDGLNNNSKHQTKQNTSRYGRKEDYDELDQPHLMIQTPSRIDTKLRNSVQVNSINDREREKFVKTCQTIDYQSTNL